MIVRVETVTAKVVRADVDIRTACHVVGRVHMGTGVEAIRVPKRPTSIERVDISQSQQLVPEGSNVFRFEHIAFGELPLEAKVGLLVVRSYNILVHVPRVGKGVEQRIVVLCDRRKRVCN